MHKAKAHVVSEEGAPAKETRPAQRRGEDDHGSRDSPRKRPRVGRIAIPPQKQQQLLHTPLCFVMTPTPRATTKEAARAHAHPAAFTHEKFAAFAHAQPAALAHPRPATLPRPDEGFGLHINMIATRALVDGVLSHFTLATLKGNATRLGKGAFSEVFRIDMLPRCPGFGDLALKVIREDDASIVFSQSKGAAEETFIGQLLTHLALCDLVPGSKAGDALRPAFRWTASPRPACPWVCPVHQVAKLRDGKMSIVMSLVHPFEKGGPGDLRAWARSPESAPRTAAVLAILAGALAAMSFASSTLGMLLNDVKPDNVLITREPRPRVLTVRDPSGRAPARRLLLPDAVPGARISDFTLFTSFGNLRRARIYPAGSEADKKVFNLAKSVCMEPYYQMTPARCVSNMTDVVPLLLLLRRDLLMGVRGLAEDAAEDTRACVRAVEGLLRRLAPEDVLAVGFPDTICGSVRPAAWFRDWLLGNEPETEDLLLEVQQHAGGGGGGERDAAAVAAFWAAPGESVRFGLRALSATAPHFSLLQMLQTNIIRKAKDSSSEAVWDLAKRLGTLLGNLLTELEGKTAKEAERLVRAPGWFFGAEGMRVTARRVAVRREDICASSHRLLFEAGEFAELEVGPGAQEGDEQDDVVLLEPHLQAERVIAVVNPRRGRPSRGPGMARTLDEAERDAVLSRRKLERVSVWLEAESLEMKYKVRNMPVGVVEDAEEWMERMERACPQARGRTSTDETRQGVVLDSRGLHQS